MFKVTLRVRRGGLTMGSFQEELVKLKGRQIKFRDTTCLVNEDFLTGEILDVGRDYVIISVSYPDTQKGKKLYNLANIVWLQVY